MLPAKDLKRLKAHWIIWIFKVHNTLELLGIYAPYRKTKGNLYAPSAYIQ